MAKELRELQDERRKVKSLKTIVEDLGARHDGVVAVTSTKQCFVLKIDDEYGPGMRAVVELADGLRNLLANDSDVSEFRVKYKRGQGFHGVRVVYGSKIVESQ